jgi:hypothetical protein
VAFINHCRKFIYRWNYLIFGNSIGHMLNIYCTNIHSKMNYSFWDMTNESQKYSLSVAHILDTTKLLPLPVTLVWMLWNLVWMVITFILFISIKMILNFQWVPFEKWYLSIFLAKKSQNNNFNVNFLVINMHTNDFFYSIRWGDDIKIWMTKLFSSYKTERKLLLK